MKVSKAIWLSAVWHLAVLLLAAATLRPARPVAMPFPPGVIVTDLVAGRPGAVSASAQLPSAFEQDPVITGALARAAVIPDREARDSDEVVPVEDFGRTDNVEIVPGLASSGVAGAPGRPAAGPLADPEKILQGRRMSEAFEAMARQQQLAAAVLQYNRIAGGDVERRVRDALGADLFSTVGTADVLLEFAASGDVVDVAVQTDSPAIRTALARVSWASVPVPARYNTPGSSVRFRVAVSRARVHVGAGIR